MKRREVGLGRDDKASGTLVGKFDHALTPSSPISVSADQHTTVVYPPVAATFRLFENSGGIFQGSRVLLCAKLADSSEFVGVETGASDQRSIDIRLMHQLGDVG